MITCKEGSRLGRADGFLIDPELMTLEAITLADVKKSLGGMRALLTTRAPLAKLGNAYLSACVRALHARHASRARAHATCWHWCHN